MGLNRFTLSQDLFDYIRPIAFALLFFWLSIFPEPVQQYYWKYFQGFLVLFLGLFLCDARYRPRMFKLYDWPLWFFLISLYAGTLMATNKSFAIHAYIYLTLTFFLLYYIGKAMNIYRCDIKGIPVVISICTCIVAFIGVAELYFHGNIMYAYFVMNPYYERSINAGQIISTQMHPLVLGSYMIAGLPFVILFAISSFRKTRLLGIIFSVVCVFVIIFTQSRGTFIAFVVQTTFFMWHTMRKRYAFVFIAAMILFVFLVTQSKSTYLQPYSYNKIIYGKGDSIISAFRAERCYITARILQKHPLTGLGFFEFREQFYKFCDLLTVSEKAEHRVPDNMYLTFLSEMGVFALLAFLFLIWTRFRRLMRFLRLCYDHEQRVFIVTLTTSMLGMLIVMASYDSFYWHVPYAIFCLFYGFLSSDTLVRLDVAGQTISKRKG